jgi:hypothetical protein
MVDILRSRSERPPFLDFEYVEEMDDEVVREWTGLGRAHFTDLFLSVPSLSNTEKRRPKTVLGVWLAKSRTGETNQRLASLVGLSRSSMKKMIGEARKALSDEWVPLHLGMFRITRDVLKSHMTTVAEELFCNADKVAVVMDGTYTYIQKSTNNAFQRASYSGHKHRPLLKPFMIVSPDGHIIDALGPNVSDATISRHIGTELRSILEEGDVVLVDRGFRDTVQHLTALSLDVRLPESNSNGQLNVEQANRTRLVTKCRFVVEVIRRNVSDILTRFGPTIPSPT